MSKVKTLAEIAIEQKEIFGTNGRELSFAWTLDRLPPVGCKEETRRKFNKRTYKLYRTYYWQQRIFPAFNKVRFAGGRQIGWCRLTDEPRVENLAQLTQGAIRREGYPELSVSEFVEKFFKKHDVYTQFLLLSFEFEPIEACQTQP